MDRGPSKPDGPGSRNKGAQECGRDETWNIKFNLLVIISRAPFAGSQVSSNSRRGKWSAPGRTLDTSRHEDNHPLITTTIRADPRRSNTENTSMDNILDSLSKKGKKLKHRLRGKKHKPDRTGADTPGEGAGSSGSFLRPEPHVVVGGSDGEGYRTSTDVQQDSLRDRSPQLEPVPAGGSDVDRQRREAEVDEKEVSKRHSRLDPDVKVVLDSEASREVERVHPSLSTGEPESA